MVSMTAAVNLALSLKLDLTVEEDGFVVVKVAQADENVRWVEESAIGARFFSSGRRKPPVWVKWY